MSMFGTPHHQHIHQKSVHPMIDFVQVYFNCKEVKIGEAGDIWITSPHYGHWDRRRRQHRVLRVATDLVRRVKKDDGRMSPMALGTLKAAGALLGPRACRPLHNKCESLSPATRHE